MIITPTKEHGPIAGKKGEPVFNPDDPMEWPDDKVAMLIKAGKAVPWEAPASADKGVVDHDPAPVPGKKKGRAKKGGKKDAGSVDAK